MKYIIATIILKPIMIIIVNISGMDKHSRNNLEFLALDGYCHV